jgi:hypothetical protein
VAVAFDGLDADLDEAPPRTDPPGEPLAESLEFNPDLGGHRPLVAIVDPDRPGRS